MAMGNNIKTRNKAILDVSEKLSIDLNQAAKRWKKAQKRVSKLNLPPTESGDSVRHY